MTYPRALLARSLEHVGRVGADPSDDEELRLRKALLLLISLLILPIALLWAGLYLTFVGWPGWIAAGYAVVSVISIVVFSRNRDFGLLLRIQLLDILLAPTISMVPLGGFVPAGATGIWGILAPLGALVFLGVRSGVRWYAVFVAVFAACGIAGILLDVGLTVAPAFSSVMLALNVTVGGTIVFTLLALFAKQREDALAVARNEHDRAEGLLLNILPGSIAARLKADPHTIADGYAAASVLFADVVDFTPRSEGMTAREVVELLDRLFSHFDALAERHGLEKIKTIGDAYMVASGVPSARPDHARALALLALAMVDSVSPGGECADLDLQLRIGINSGPVVAGVIGRKKFLYDLWGDAVNTASRMESGGTPNRIQVTRATYELLHDEFDFERRGTIPVKGKGEMETWYLVGRRTGATPAEAAVPA